MNKLEKIYGIKSKEELKEKLEKYLDEDMSSVKIGEIFGVSAQAIHSWMKKFNLSRKRRKLHDRDYLYQAYYIKKKSMAEISREMGLSNNGAVDLALKKFGFEKRSVSEIQKIASERYRPNGGFNYFSKGKGKNYRSFGYVIEYKGHTFLSACEFTFALIKESEGKTFETQPFFFHRSVPDIWIKEENKVYEIKSSSISKEDTIRYQKVGEQLRIEKGLDYQVVIVPKEWPKEYSKVIKYLRKNSNGPGNLIKVTENPLDL